MRDMRPSETRQSLRIPMRRAMTLEVRMPGSAVSLATKEKRSAVSANSSNLSRTGVGLEIAKDAELPIGSAVRISLQISGRTISVPGHVVWTKSGDVQRAGVKLHVEVADAATRRNFENFVRDAERAHLDARGS